MGNYRFKLSELIPNAWFYKLKDMAKSRKHHHPIHTFPPSTATAPVTTPRRSSYHSRPLKSAPSSSLRRRASTVRSKSSAPNHPTSSALLDFPTDTTATVTASFSPDFRSDQVLLPAGCHSPCSCVASDFSRAPATFTPPQQLELRPIITKPANGPKKAASSQDGVRLRLRSPRISMRKSVSSSASRSAVGGGRRRSRAVVKTSVDPRRDFKESMEEMIAENNIRESKDLEELLACYLCLNSDEYHAVIINVFKQLWLDLNLQSSN